MRQESSTRAGHSDPVPIPGTVVLATGRCIPVTITGGVDSVIRVQSEEMLPIAATVRLELDCASASAQVLWTFGGDAGLQLCPAG